MRFTLAGVAFAVALLLTPRALLDVTEHADSHEVPVDVLDPSEDGECLWCSELPDQFEDVDCDELEDRSDLRSSPDDVDPDELPSECRDEAPMLEPSA